MFFKRATNTGATFYSENTTILSTKLLRNGVRIGAHIRVRILVTCVHLSWTSIRNALKVYLSASTKTVTSTEIVISEAIQYSNDTTIIIRYRLATHDHPQITTYITDLHLIPDYTHV